MVHNEKSISFKITYKELDLADALGDDHMEIAKAYDNLIDNYQKSRELNDELMEYLKKYETENDIMAK